MAVRIVIQVFEVEATTEGRDKRELASVAVRGKDLAEAKEKVAKLIPLL